MRKNLLATVFVCLGFILGGSLFAQTWDDLVEEIRGDTLVIKGTSNSGGTFNTIGIVIKGDTTETGERNNPNRVYETMVNQVYISDAPFIFDETVGDLVITAPEWDMADADNVPPLWIKSVDSEGVFNKNYFYTPGSFYMENQYILMALLDGQRDREFGRALGDNAVFEFHHNVFELTNWCLHYPRANHQVFKFTDNLFINVGYEATLEKGNVFDSWYVTDTLWMENNTFLNVGNVSLARPYVSPSFAYFNHNTMVNATMPPFMFFEEAEMVVTNNMIINQSLMPDYPDFYTFHQDADKLPKGIINVDTMRAEWIADNWPDGYPVEEADRKILVDKNTTWWDPRFQDMFDNQLPPFPDTIDEVWASQMIRMNDRTAAMFADDDAYPYFVEGTWYDGDPGFANNKDLVPEWIDFIVTNSTPGDPNGGNNMPWWRTNDQPDENLVQPDWPPLADLSYSDAEMNTGAVNSYPVGDLNWYPELKASWEQTGEPAKLIEALKAGQLPEDWAGVGIEQKEIDNGPASLVSLYPNPASGQLYLRSDYELGNLVIFDVVGQVVKQMDLNRISNVNLDISDLNNGVYILQVETVSGEISSSKFVKK
ncbi:MAG: T9SS type A sorting domain-containing protein [Bacteroidales bacterium]